MSLPTEFQQYIGISKYQRWLEEEKRRETWPEAGTRYMDYFNGLYPKALAPVYDKLKSAIIDTEVMPSMRALMTAGKPLERDNVAGYNCAYTAVDKPRIFDEAIYILACGTGLGFSCKRKYTEKLPEIAEEFYDTQTIIKVRDSKIGWAKAYRELISMLYQGQVPQWDVSKVRPKGARLKTFGGRASGPEPLIDLFKYTVNTFRRFAGSKLPPIAVHDIMCKVAEIVVVGGVRRSALISISDLDDEFMRVAKSPVNVIEYTLLGYSEEDEKRKYSVVVNDAPYGERSLILELGDWESEQLQRDHTVHWRHVHPERALSNNSIGYESRPHVTTLMKEWVSLIESYSGERGIFNSEAANNLLPERRKAFGYEDYGCNPCSEIVLRSGQFCNLTEVVVRSEDTFDDLRRKVEIATILGTLQATQTNFRYLSSTWKKNTEEEALLGVSFTGIMDHPVMSGAADFKCSEEFADPSEFGLGDEEYLEDWLEELKAHAVEVNREWAKTLGINPAAAITCVKPSGTVSQLVDSASGIHPRHAPYYLRTVRADKKDPLAQMMVDMGFPVEDDIMKPNDGYVFSFPMKAPEGSIFRDDRSAIEQLELWKVYQLHWCEHKPSITVYVKDDEWSDVLAWVDKNFDILSGVSFLPHDGGSYAQAPYQDLTEEEYNAWVDRVPTGIDWVSKLAEFESYDTTTGMQEYACTGNACEFL